MKRKGGARSARSNFRASLGLCLATLALLAQLLAPASHRMAAPADVGGVAADLKAAFGDVAVLCIQAGNENNPLAPVEPSRHCDDCCPLCQCGAGAHPLILATVAGAPERIAALAETLAPERDFVRLKPDRTAFAQPRAPPFEA
jgi:hypothetical protein